MSKVNQNLRPFETISNISVKAELNFLDQHTISLDFIWDDLDEDIIFFDQGEPTEKPIRQMGLWQETCFEAFIKPVNGKTKDSYFEINISPFRKWNFFAFSNYRQAEDPMERQEVDLVYYHVDKNSLTAHFRLKDFVFAQADVSICSVIKTNSQGLTYWSTKHADTKPNFHHFDSFSLKRSCN